MIPNRRTASTCGSRRGLDNARVTSTRPTGAPTASPATRYLILGTAGHIDHGKTSLVRALTGTDTDRLPEERLRGMTIELGFAEMTVEGTRFGVVDVPGHERFVRTMVAGATGIDIALLVVAADDSVMPQTIEHVEILDLLGVRRGVAAITKTDVVDADLVEFVREDIRQLLSGTRLAGAAICPVSSVSGVGLEELKSAILATSTELEVSPGERPFRMAVDRVFTVQGRGTVVTGSVLRGTVAAGDTLEILPEVRSCRVRGLQTHGTDFQTLSRGQRAAVNISGVDRTNVTRGCQLATPGYLQPSRIVDVSLRCLSSAEQGIKSAATFRLNLGTSDIPVRVVLHEGRRLEPGTSGFAQLRSGEPLAVTFGQRFILRDEAAMRTIGGGRVLRPTARRKRRDGTLEVDSLRRLDEGQPVERVGEVLRLAGFKTPMELQLSAAAGVEPARIRDLLGELRDSGRWGPVAGTTVFAVSASIDDLRRRLVGWLERYHLNHPEQPGRHVDSVCGWLDRLAGRELGRPLLDLFRGDQSLKILGRFVCLPAFAPALSGADEKLLAAILNEVRAGGFQPPSLDELSAASQTDRKRLQRLVLLAVALGELVQVESKMYLHADVEAQLRAKVAELIGRAGAVTVADVRETLNSTRKYVVPFLEYLDRVGFTVRTDDRRGLATDGAGRP